MTSKAILCVSNCRGQISALSEKAELAGAAAVIHVGEFGFVDDQSILTLPEARLRALLSNCPILSKDQVEIIMSKEREQIIDILLSMSISLSEVSDYAALKKSLKIPLYVIASRYEDRRIVDSFVQRTRVIPNLHVISKGSFSLAAADGRSSVRVFCLGGGIPDEILPSSTAYGATSMLDIAEFIMGSLPQASPAELRIFATSLPSHPLVDQLAGVIDADLVLKSSPSGSPSLITRENFNAKAATQRYSQEFLTGFEAKLKALQQEPDAVRSRREFLLIEFLQKIARFNVYNDKEFRPAFADLPGLNEGHVLVEAYENSLSFRFASYVTTKLRRRAFEELSSGAVYNFPNGEDSSASHLSVRATTSPQRMEPIKIKGEQRSGNDQVAVPAPTLPLRSASDASTQMAGLTDGRDSPAGSEGKVPPPALSGQAQTQWPTTTKGDRSNWESGSNWSSDADSFAPEAGVSTLWVGNFKDETTLEDLKGFFRSISFVRIRLSKNSPDKRPCAYVDILEEDMERALRLSGERLHGVRLKIEYDPNRLNKLRRTKADPKEDIETCFNDPRTFSEVQLGEETRNGSKKGINNQVGATASPGDSSGSHTPTDLRVPPLESQATTQAPSAGTSSSSNSGETNGSLSKVVPAGWTRPGCTPTWDSPPRKPTTFSTGAHWDKPDAPSQATSSRPWEMPQAKPSTKMEPDSQKWALAEATVNMKLSGNTIAPAAEWIPPPLLAAQQQAHWMNADGQYPLQDPSRLEASPDLMWNSESSGTAGSSLASSLGSSIGSMPSLFGQNPTQLYQPIAAPSARRSVDFGAKIKQPSSLWSDGAIWGAAGTSTMLARSQSALQQTSELLMDKQLSHHNPSLKHYEEEVRRKGSLPNLKMQDNMPQQDWHDASAAAQPKRATVTGGLLRTSYAGQLAGMPEFYGLRSGSSARPGLESVFPQRVGTPSTQTSMHKANGDQGMSRAQRFDVTSFDLGMAQGAPQASQQLQQPHQLQPHLFPGQQQSLSISPSIWVGHEQTGATSSSASSTSFWPPTPTSTAASIGQPPQWTF